MNQDKIESGSLYYLDSLETNVIFILIAVDKNDEDDIICLKLNLQTRDIYIVYRTKYTLQRRYGQLF